MGAAYRYWRIRLTGTPSGSKTIYFGLVGMREAADGSGANLSVTGNGTASCSAGSGQDLAFDGDIANSWQLTVNSSYTSGAWLMWDFGAGVAHDINHLTLYTANFAYNVAGMDLVLQGSADLLSWEDRILVPGGIAPLTTVTYSTNLPFVVAPKTAPLWWSGPAPPPGAVRGPRVAAFWDTEDGGQYRIVGTVKVKGTPNLPVYRRVVLINERSRRIVRETWSDPVTGAYAFEGIRGDVTYTTMTYDHTSAHLRATAADGLTAERMP